ncbi:hypothetical protein [Janthinobacterium agaricidamnosum]|uniref:Ribosomal protein S3AE n=1 Tax=Janthinobacterium agaricidamnosum NBRC 102515 = DSM 9628 TaxID=1349767 RepID=W0V3N0_9BURK|nr:hypothetical protein [Janthinobacterium agaricidamnosum]CDG81887.1 putative uncharacterized protein [Janthinobacterium agaricidamnosum NBRC 102515 = DSM 9628]
MPATLPFPIRTECPPPLCVCQRDVLLQTPDGDLRILRLTREEEKKLIDRIEAIGSYQDLLALGMRMKQLLGIELHIEPGPHEVRSARGLTIALGAQAGLCRKTRQAVPAAIRRCLDNHPEIIYALLNAHDLLAGQ